MRTILMQNNSSVSSSNQERRQEGGFSLLEMVIAMVILTVGLLGVASAIGYALMASNSGRSITNSKLLVVSVLEQMETLRDSGQLNFAEIANVADLPSGTSFAGFSPGFQRVTTTPGVDGIFGTADDPTATSLIRPGVTREIVITTLGPLLKKVQVTVRYATNGSKTTDLVGFSYLNDDAHSNYIP